MIKMCRKKIILSTMMVTAALVIILMILTHDVQVPYELKSKLYFVFDGLYEYQPVLNKWIVKEKDIFVCRSKDCDLKNRKFVYYDIDDSSIKIMNIENGKALKVDSCKYLDRLSIAPNGYIGYLNQGKYCIKDLDAEDIFSFSFEFAVVPERCVSWSPSSKFMAISDGDKIYLANIEKKKVDFIANGSGPRFISSNEFVFFKASKEKANFYLLNIQSGTIDEICSTHLFRDYDITSDLSYLVRLGYSVSSVNIVLRDIEKGKDILLPRPPCRKGKGGAVFFDNYNRQD